MCEEAFDEVIIPCEDGMVLHVTGGYGREEVCLGIGRPTEDDRKAGCAGMPALVILLDREARTALTYDGRVGKQREKNGARLTGGHA